MGLRGDDAKASAVGSSWILPQATQKKHCGVAIISSKIILLRRLSSPQDFFNFFSYFFCPIWDLTLSYSKIFTFLKMGLFYFVSLFFFVTGQSSTLSPSLHKTHWHVLCLCNWRWNNWLLFVILPYNSITYIETHILWHISSHSCFMHDLHYNIT